ncbi:MAG: glycosyltransferase family 39 protein [Bacteroidia bacterium]
MLAIPVEIMDVDAAQYASMGREMLENGDFLHVYDRGNEYLDKPPFIFWITAISYSIFGVSNFAFKLPAILFAILGIFSVFRFTKLWYDRETGILAALILATSQGYFHFTNDVRTDVYLTNSVIACVWMLSEQLKAPKSNWWIPAFIFAGIGMLAKGPLGLVAPALAVGSHVLLKKDWKNLFNWRWIAGVIVAFIVLLPMLIGLYTQFDAEPDKWVNGKQNVSGLRFFFWEQSFGRLTGENVWKNDSGPFFFVHSFAWSFLPWTLFFIASLVDWVVSVFKKSSESLKSHVEWMTLGGFFLPFIALSASRYKLPHYIYVVFPFAAAFTAVYLLRLYRSSKQLEVRRLKIIQSIVLFECWAFAGVLFI